MKRAAILLCSILAALSYSIAQSSVYVRPYLKKDGTLVQGHFRSVPNETVFDNWSVYPNINPYTGQAGTKDPWTEYFKQLGRKSSSYHFNYYVPRVSSEYSSGSYLDTYQNDRSGYYDLPTYFNYSTPSVFSRYFSGNYLNSYLNHLSTDYDAPIYVPDFSIPRLPSSLELQDDTTPYDELDSSDPDPEDE
jgi:hypothetical protein